MYLQVLLVCVFVFVTNSEAGIYAEIRITYKEKLPEQKLFSLPYINGSNLSDLKIKLMNFTKRDDWDLNTSILSFSDFPDLVQLDMNNLLVGRLPTFSNLPKLTGLSASGNIIQIIDKEWFSDTPIEIVFLDKNKIKKIENESFGEFVTTVDLSCNELTELSSKWFSNPENMELLALKSNKIMIIPSGFLRSFPNLTELDLSYNQITTIESAALTGRRNMETINLSVNKISEIPPEVFENKKHYIHYFDISYNRLNYLKSRFLDNLALVEFRIYGNPWHCTCLKTIEDWMSEKSVVMRKRKVSGEPICIYPLSYADKCVEIVDNELYKSYSKSLIQPPPPVCF